jgi:hypothetical protein
MESRKLLYNSSFKAGLIIGVVGIALFIIEYAADIKPVGFIKPILMLLLGIAINVAVLVFMLKKFRTEIGGYISFGDAFLYCLIALITASIISTIFTFLFIQFFEPDYMKNIMQSQKDWMENYLSGKVSDEQMTAALEKIDQQAGKMTPISQSVRSLIGGVVMGAVIALIVGAIMKKNPNVFDNVDKGGVI